MRKKIVIVTTVPITLTGILIEQPKYLNDHFDIAIISSPGNALCEVEIMEAVPTYSVPMQRGISPFKDLISLFKMVKKNTGRRCWNKFKRQVRTHSSTMGHRKRAPFYR